MGPQSQTVSADGFLILQILAFARAPYSAVCLADPGSSLGQLTKHRKARKKNKYIFFIVYCIHFDTRRTKTKFNGKINFICNFENHFCYEGYLKEPKAVGYIQEVKIIALKGTMLKCYLILRHL